MSRISLVRMRFDCVHKKIRLLDQMVGEDVIWFKTEEDPVRKSLSSDQSQIPFWWRAIIGYPSCSKRTCSYTITGWWTWRQSGVSQDLFCTYRWGSVRNNLIYIFNLLSFRSWCFILLHWWLSRDSSSWLLAARQCSWWEWRQCHHLRVFCGPSDQLLHCQCYLVSKLCFHDRKLLHNH